MSRPRRRASDWTIWTGLALWLAVTVLLGLAMLTNAATGGREGWLLGGFGLFAVLVGLVVAVGLYRQYFLGQPHAAIGDEGVRIGRRTIPWSEILDVRALGLLGVPYVGVFVRKPAARRFPILGRSDWVAYRDGTLMVELTEAQLGFSVESAVLRANEVRPRSVRLDVG